MITTINCVIGLVLGIFIGIYITHNLSVIYHGPNSNDIKKYVWHDQHTDKYYKFETIPYVCPPMMKGCIPTS